MSYLLLLQITPHLHVKNLKEAISDKLQAQYLNQNVSMILDVCSFLDPRFRIAYLANKISTLVQIENEACEVAEEMINENVEFWKKCNHLIKTEEIGNNFEQSITKYSTTGTTNNT